MEILAANVDKYVSQMMMLISASVVSVGLILDASFVLCN